MFQFPRCPPRALCVRARVCRLRPARVAPFGNPRLSACQPLPEAFRRVATPFIGPADRGIHRVPIPARSPTGPPRRAAPTAGRSQPGPTPPPWDGAPGPHRCAIDATEQRCTLHVCSNCVVHGPQAQARPAAPAATTSCTPLSKSHLPGSPPGTLAEGGEWWGTAVRLRGPAGAPSVGSPGLPLRGTGDPLRPRRPC